MLDFKALKSITVGAVEIWQEDDGVHFSKCSEAQLEKWAKADPPCILDNAKATTGIRLDFYTNSCFVEVEASQGNKFEVIIDGVLTHQFLRENDGVFTFKFNLKADGKQSHVVITLPSHNPAGVIKSVKTEDGATVTPHKFDKKILFLGDSITQGWDAKFDSLSFPYLISDFFNAESIIQGIGTSRFEPSTVIDFGFKPDIIFVAYGTNDFGHLNSLGELTANEESYLKKVTELYQGAKIYLISPTYRTDFDFKAKMGSSFEDCCNAVISTAKRLGLTVIDGDKLLPHNDKFLADYLHPNDLGFCIYALNLLKSIS